MRSTKSEESLTSLHNLEGNYSLKLCNWLSVAYVASTVYFCDNRRLNVHVLSIPGEPPRYRPVRPRSTSEAISSISRGDLHNTRLKHDHRTPQLNESHNGADRVRTTACISPPHQEDDLDLCPPAVGISTLDFDPMSFQCSPHSATPGPQHSRDGNKWKKSRGFSSESEPVSPPKNNVSCSQSPDNSPVLGTGLISRREEGRGGKKVHSKLVSPKLRKKSFKAQADVQIASAPVLPLPSSSSPVEKGEALVADGKAPYQHCSPLSTASQPSALTDLTPSAQNLPDPGQCQCSLASCISFTVLYVVRIDLNNNAFCSFL